MGTKILDDIRSDLKLLIKLITDFEVSFFRLYFFDIYY